MKDNVKLRTLGEIFIGLTYRPEDVANEGTIVLRSSNIQNGKCYDRFSVEKIAIENKKIVGISIINNSIKSDNIKDNRCFVWSAK